MSSRDLFELLQTFKTELSEKKSGERFRVSVPDVWQHRVVIDKEDVKKELRIQFAELARPGRKAGELGLSREATQRFKTREEQEQFLSEQGQEFKEKDIEELATFYINNLISQFSSRIAGYTIEIERTGNTVIIILTRDADSTAGKKEFLESLGKQGPVFAKLSTAFANARDALIRQTKQKLKLNVKTGEFILNIGHITAVAELRAGAVLAEISRKDIKALLGTLEFTGLSDLVKSHSELIKKFDTQIAWVKPQSAVANNLASKYDATILNQVREAIDRSMNEMLDKDWANQSGSNSLIEAILAEFIETATKHKAKVNYTIPKDFSKNKAKTNLPIETRTSTRTYKSKIGDISSFLQDDIGVSTTVNLRTLIPMLNQRLPEIVRSHMGQSGRLVNRTGRFAESTEIIDIDSQGTLLTYSYMRNPYGVFESHPTRDPRPLIEQSIRELARGLIAQKFNMRRV